MQEVSERSLEVVDLGRVDCREAYRLQEHFIERNWSEGIDTLLFCEHYPVITIGRGGSHRDILVSSNFLKEHGISVLEVNRGGALTYHGPGQIVFYPLLNLRRYKQDIRWYLRRLEDVVIDFLSQYNLEGRRRAGYTGVWLDGKKIASIGVGFRRWISFHGVAVNINIDLTPFSYLRPCGLNGDEITSLREVLNADCDMEEGRRLLSQGLMKVFKGRETPSYERSELT